MVELQLPKLVARVRFPSLAPDPHRLPLSFLNSNETSLEVVETPAHERARSRACRRRARRHHPPSGTAAGSAQGSFRWGFAIVVHREGAESRLRRRSGCTGEARPVYWRSSARAPSRAPRQHPKPASTSTPGRTEGCPFRGGAANGRWRGCAVRVIDVGDHRGGVSRDVLAVPRGSVASPLSFSSPDKLSDYQVTCLDYGVEQVVWRQHERALSKRFDQPGLQSEALRIAARDRETTSIHLHQTSRRRAQRSSI